MQDRIAEEQAGIREAQEFIARQEQEIRNQVARDTAGNIDDSQTSTNLKNKINEVEGRVRNAQVRIESGERPEGFSLAYQDGTIRNNLEITRIVTKEVLALYKNNPNYYTRILPPDSIGRRVLDQLVARIDNPQSEVTLIISPYVQKIIHAAINNAINNPLEVLSDSELGILNVADRILHQKVVEALSQTARQVGRTDDEIRVFEDREAGRTEEVQRRVDEEARRRMETAGYAGGEMIKKLAPEHPRMSRLYEALSSIESFNEYYRDRINTFRNTQNPQKAASEEIITDMIHIVNIIERPVLHKSPEEPFEQLEQQAGEFGSTPNFVFSHIYDTMLGNLQAKATTARERGEGEDLAFYEYTRERKEMFLDGKNQTVLVVTPGAKLEETDKGLEDFVEFLREVVSSEREALRYGFNFTFLLKRGPPPQKDEFWFKQLAEYAAHLKSHHLDMSRALPYSNEIQAMEMILSDMYRKEFGFLAQWTKKVGLMEEFFSRFSVVEKNVMEMMRRKKMPDGSNIPEWVVERSLHQARMKFFGIDFMLNSMAGYMDPDWLEKATNTFVSEGDYYGLFDIWALGKRFRFKDNEIAGLMYMPVDQQVFWYNHKKISEEGRGIFDRLLEEGQSAKFGSKYFEGNLQENGPYNGVLMEGEISNLTEAGGVDTLDSWRNLYQYLQWLQFKGGQEVNPETKNLDFSKPMVLVNSWKRIENLGVSILRNYTEQLIFGGGGFDTLSDMEVLEVVNPEEAVRYEEFLRFLYRRYLNVENGVGNAFLQKRDATGRIRKISENEYIQDFKDILREINKENFKVQGRKLKSLVYQALTVAMFERMPLDFILMENKPRITQNGVTMLSEIQKYYKKQMPEADRWNDAQFSEALDDLIFVQQEARVKTLEGMERTLRDNENLFGDLSQDRSTAMNGRAYIVDEDFIRNVLSTLPDNIREERISRAKDLYKKIKDIIVQLPSANKAQQNNPGEYERRKRYYGSRMKWWADALEKKKFGFSLTSAEKAQKFLNYSATGPETTKRAANFCANTAELAFKSFVGGFKDSCLAAESEKKNDQLVNWLYPIKKGVESEWGEEMAFKVATRFQQMQIYMFRADDKANLPGGAARDWVLDQTSSLIQEFKGPRRSTWLWGKDEIYNLVTDNEAKNIVPKHTNPEDRKYRDTTASQQFGVLGKLAESINGGPIYLKNLPGPFKNLARDYGNEFSGEGLRGHNKARLPEAFGLKALGLALFLLFIYLKSAFEKDQKKG